MIINYATAESILEKVEDEGKNISLEELGVFLKAKESDIEDLHMRMIGEREGENDFILYEEDSLLIGHILNVLDATDGQLIEQSEMEHRYELENDKTQLYMKNLLVWLDEHFDGEELYNILADKIHMTDEDISSCGFESLSEYFEDHSQTLTQI